MNTSIKNWKEVTDKFGYNNSKKGERRPYSAKQISKLLHEETFKRFKAKKPIDEGLLIPCGSESELDCIFKLESSFNNNFIFSYEGVVG
jgi:hypothetical protein